jgi:hypothetical protein
VGGGWGPNSRQHFAQLCMERRKREVLVKGDPRRYFPL